MPIIKRQKPVDRQLRPKIIILPTQQLLPHPRPNLRLEIQNRPKPKISAFPTLVILRMLDPPTTSKGVHARIDILVEMQSLLRLGYTPAGGHVQRVQEIRVSVVQLPANPRHRSRRERTKRLFLPSSQITQDTNVLRKDILARTDDGHRRLLEILMAPLCIRTLRRNRILLKLGEHIPNLKALLEVVVLVGVDKLEVLPTIKDDRMVLVIRLSIPKNRVPRKLNAELGPPTPRLGYKLAVPIDKRRKDPGVTPFLPRRLLFQIRNLQIRVRAQQKLGILMLLLVELGEPLHRNDKLEFAPCHPLELPLQFISVATEQLYDLGVLDAVKQLDGLGIIHHAGNCPVQGLSAKRCPDTCSEGEFGCGALETDEIEREIVDLGLTFLVVGKGVDTIEHGRLFHEDLGILDEILPLDRMQLFEVFQERNTGVLIFFTDNFSERQKSLRSE